MKNVTLVTLIFGTLVACVYSGQRFTQNGKTYYVSEKKVSFLEAYTFCRDEGMQLLSIETEKENEYIVDLLNKLEPKMSSNNYWMSATNLGHGNYYWLSTGKPVLYTDWHRRQPDNIGNSENCVELRKSVRYFPDILKWNDRSYSETGSFICENVDNSAPNVTKAQIYNNVTKSYFVSEKKVNFFQANILCRDQGMQLLSIKTEKKNEYIVELLKKLEPKMDRTYWMSATNLGDGNYYWLSTGKPVLYIICETVNTSGNKSFSHFIYLGSINYEL